MSSGRKKLRVLVLMHEDLVPPDDIKSIDASEAAEADWVRYQRLTR